MAKATRNSLSRRSALTAAAAVVLAPGTALSAEAPVRLDPIIKAIVRHKVAEDQLEEDLRKLPASFDFDRPRDYRRYRLMRKPVDLAAVALIETVPTTPGGVAALLWYVRQNQERDLSFSCNNVLRIMKRRAAAVFARIEAA